VSATLAPSTSQGVDFAAPGTVASVRSITAISFVESRNLELSSASHTGVAKKPFRPIRLKQTVPPASQQFISGKAADRGS
jgi:hypothetical protein